MDIKKTVEIAQALITLAEKEGWSEEELAKAINLLHSELSATPLMDMNVGLAANEMTTDVERVAELVYEKITRQLADEVESAHGTCE